MRKELCSPCFVEAQAHGAIDLLILDDFGLDAMDATERRDIYEILTGRNRRGSIVLTSNRGPTNGSPPSPTRSASTATATTSFSR